MHLELHGSFRINQVAVCVFGPLCSVTKLAVPENCRHDASAIWQLEWLALSTYSIASTGVNIRVGCNVGSQKSLEVM